jgi:hypothetical protein
MNTPTVLITGARTGIGRATALAFAREGELEYGLVPEFSYFEPSANPYTSLNGRYWITYKNIYDASSRWLERAS